MIVKVCGMRDHQNIESLCRLPIDMIGFIFYDKSPRYYDTEVVDIPDHIQRVGVFVQEHTATIKKIAAKHLLDYVQLHGKESVEQCLALKDVGLKVIKAISVHSLEDIERCDPYVGVVDLLLFDTATPAYGGSGEKFPWELLNHYKGSTRFLLSGGIGLSDAQALLSFHHPQFLGVDLNSRFETSPGMKSIDQLKAFLNLIK